MNGRMLVAAVLLAGCANLSTRAESVCVPAGLPPFVLWQAGPADATVYDDERGVPVIAIIRFYRVGPVAIKVVWVDGMLATVDPEPENPATPVWVDDGVIAESLRFRVDRASACQWRRVAPVNTPTRETI